MNGFRRAIFVVLALMLAGFGAAMAAAQIRLPFISDGEGRPAPRLIVLCQAALREELHQGDWGVFGIGALLTLLVMAWVLLSEAVFQFRALLWARGTGGRSPRSCIPPWRGCPGWP